MHQVVKASEAEGGQGWEHEATVYLWLPSVDGTLGFNAPSGGGSVDVDASDILSALDIAFMGILESRRGPWSLVFDFIYLDLSDTKNSTVNISPGSGPGVNIATRVDLGIEGWTTSALLGHTLIDKSPTQVDLAAGLRYFNLDADAVLATSGPLMQTPLPLSRSAELLDVIVALRGRYTFNDAWSLRYHFDIGTGDSNLTWQAAGGLVWDHSWGNVKLYYRHLAYDQKAGALLDDFSFSGPVIGVGFRF